MKYGVGQRTAITGQWRFRHKAAVQSFSMYVDPLYFDVPVY